ncbi:uncharacterized protein BDZ83DRAFT_52480 [Colletotrichum acutatum]|uniref:Uncharacterized protein n=1 Tax=Glomerella acutata TaxID=27357 RepID=A0AAD8XL27_GLOAC|nr:uncharacterized protein BDZ83DRAFT_52480 [Colletotrichum acutatum]KAK1729373.1 hypothetical protein BDZ83DRAFT_52480 [Colletotrichum acutatum]
MASSLSVTAQGPTSGMDSDQHPANVLAFHCISSSANTHNGNFSAVFDGCTSKETRRDDVTTLNPSARRYPRPVSSASGQPTTVLIVSPVPRSRSCRQRAYGEQDRCRKSMQAYTPRTTQRARLYQSAIGTIALKAQRSIIESTGAPERTTGPIAGHYRKDLRSCPSHMTAQSPASTERHLRGAEPQLSGASPGLCSIPRFRTQDTCRTPERVLHVATLYLASGRPPCRLVQLLPKRRLQRRGDVSGPAP